MFMALATGYKAPVMKPSRCGKESQVDLAGGKREVKNSRGDTEE